MKFQTILPLAALAASTALTSAQNQAPIGQLSIDTDMVRSGGKPVLNWNIAYPSTTVEDVITIENNDSIVTKQDLQMDVRLLGASYQPFGRDAVVNFQLKVGSNSWVNAFQGTDGEINPSEVVYSTSVSAGSEVNFAGAGNVYRNYWTPSRNTLSENLNVIALKNGDPVPTYTPAFSQGGIEDHVSAYIDNGTIALGPRDVIYLMEIGQTNTLSGGFDMQDLVVVVTFDEINESTSWTNSTTTTTSTSTNTDASGNTSEDTKNNNGHGNNEDSVDVSNPGASMEGEDSDPSVDDEIKRRRR